MKLVSRCNEKVPVVLVGNKCDLEVDIFGNLGLRKCERGIGGVGQRVQISRNGNSVFCVI
jgi:hypothetical protein